MERSGQIVADRLDPNGPAALAGVRSGDAVVSVNGRTINSTAALHPPTLLFRGLFESHVLADPGRGSTRCGGCAGARRTLHERLAAADRADLPRDRAVCAASALDCDWHRRIFIFFAWSLHLSIRCTTRASSILRLDRSLEQRSRLDPAAGVVPALCSDFSGAARIRQQAQLGAASLYLPGAVLLLVQIVALQFLKASARLLWNLNRVHWAYLTIFFVSAAVVLWRNYRQAINADPAATAEVDHARHRTGDRAVYVVLRSALSVRRHAFAGNEGYGAFARIAAAHFWICHCPLPV